MLTKAVQASPTPLQIFRHDPATQVVVKSSMGKRHSFPSLRQIMRGVMDSLDPIWCGRPLGISVVALKNASVACTACSVATANSSFKAV